jgi:DNA-binding transcriptional MerR regulator
MLPQPRTDVPMKHYRISEAAARAGLTKHTVRAWERRYGLPAPKRTSTRYRLYSDADVEVLRRMGRLLEQGVAPAEAAKICLTSEVTLHEDVAKLPGERVRLLGRLQDATALLGDERLSVLVQCAEAFAGLPSQPPLSIYEGTVNVG